MSAHAVDAYLDELLAPVEEAATREAKLHSAPSAAPASAPAPVTEPAPEVPMPAAIAQPAPAPKAVPKAREHEDAATPPAPTGSRWLRAILGPDRYAFELLRVQEVVRMAPIIAMRGASAAMLGVMNLRGRIVPVLDLALWLGTGRVEPDEQARIIVVERNDELIGVLVSGVDDVVTLAREHIEPPLRGTEGGSMLGVARVGRLPTVLLDTAQLFE